MGILAQPLFHFEVNKVKFNSRQPPASLRLTFQEKADGRWTVSFRNISRDTLMLRNVVPQGEVYITGLGEHPLSRAHLFLPERVPVNVVLPDNAWELGYASKGDGSGGGVSMLMRRNMKSLQKAERRRFETVLFPEGSVEYHTWQLPYEGEWQEGLRLMFQDRKLFDLDRFDSTLYHRKDLDWIRKAYVMHLIMAWDKFYYDSGRVMLDRFAERGQPLYGGDDVIGIWPTWPTLGLDQRNQFDLYRDLPGGTSGLRKIFSDSGSFRPRIFVAYNPWDESTRQERHLSGLRDLLYETGADGVVLDTRGESSKELQDAADSVKPGIIMYSEGMAVPKDMPFIVSGRVHNALYYVPMLNLNKFIKPDFAIFRVAELYKEPVRREFALSLFNGYGTELNIFAPGQPSWVTEQYRYLGRTSMILRQNSGCFSGGRLTPLVPVDRDSVWVNEWRGNGKTIYTVFSNIASGTSDVSFKLNRTEGYHAVSLWQHRELKVFRDGGQWKSHASTDGFNISDLGTNNEGGVDVVALLPELLTVSRSGDYLSVNAPRGDVRIWAGHPAYHKTPLVVSKLPWKGRISGTFGRYEGDLVVQLMEGDELLDERVLTIIPGEARRVSEVTRTAGATRPLGGMVRIPAGQFTFHVTNGDAFIPYSAEDVDSTFEMREYYMDRFPVTNREFLNFLKSTGYRPRDTSNFLRHWRNGRPIR